MKPKPLIQPIALAVKQIQTGDLADLLGAAVQEVHWELTNHCNLKCVHCYLAPDERRELTTAEIKNLMDQIFAAGGLWLTLTGGEPLLRPDFPEIYAYAFDKGFFINVFTNGTRISGAIIDLFQQRPPYSIEITLNGITPETFEGVTAVPGSFQKCRAGIIRLHEAGHRLILKTNGMTINIHEVLKIKEWVGSLPGVLYKFDSALMPRRDHDLAPTRLRLKPHQLIDLYEEDRQMREEIQRACHDLPNHAPPTTQAFTCAAAKSRFHISAWGDLHPCHTVRPLKVSLLKTPFTEAIVRLRELVDAVEMPKDSKCNGCKIFAECASCPGLAHLEKRQHALPVSYHCEITHEVVKKYAPENL